MNTFEELTQATQSDLNVLDEAPLYPKAVVQTAVNRAYIKASSLFKWSGTESAKKTSTQKNLEYYDYPREFRDNSIYRIEVDGVQYGEKPDGSPMHYHDYLTWRANSDNANSTNEKWANQKRRYFLYPVPTTHGDFNISVWGRIVPDQLVADGDATIFSYSMPEGNEAIVLEAVAILKSKGEEEQPSQFRSLEAKQILVVAWNKIREEKAKYEKVEPFFNVPDYFYTGYTRGRNRIGNF